MQVQKGAHTRLVGRALFIKLYPNVAQTKHLSVGDFCLPPLV